MINNDSKNPTILGKLVSPFRSFGGQTNTIDAYAKIIFPTGYIITTLLYYLWVDNIEDFKKQVVVE